MEYDIFTIKTEPGSTLAEENAVTIVNNLEEDIKTETLEIEDYGSITDDVFEEHSLWKENSDVDPLWTPSNSPAVNKPSEELLSASLGLAELLQIKDETPLNCQTKEQDPFAEPKKTTATSPKGNLTPGNSTIKTESNNESEIQFSIPMQAVQKLTTKELSIFASKFVSCKFCLGFFPKSIIDNHITNCKSKTSEQGQSRGNAAKQALGGGGLFLPCKSCLGFFSKACLDLHVQFCKSVKTEPNEPSNSNPNKGNPKGQTVFLNTNNYREKSSGCEKSNVNNEKAPNQNLVLTYPQDQHDGKSGIQYSNQQFRIPNKANIPQIIADIHEKLPLTKIPSRIVNQNYEQTLPPKFCGYENSNVNKEKTLNQNTVPTFPQDKYYGKSESLLNSNILVKIPNVGNIPPILIESSDELPQTRKSNRKINKSNEQTIPPKFYEYENSNVNKEKALNQIIVPTFPQDKHDWKSARIQNSNKQLRQPNVAIIPQMIAEIHKELPRTRKSNRQVNKSIEQTIPPKFYEYENSNVNKEKALNQIIVPTFPQDKHDWKSARIQNSNKQLRQPNVAIIPQMITEIHEELPQTRKSSRQLNKSNEQTIPPKFCEYENSNVNKEKALNQIIVPTFPQDKHDWKSARIQNSNKQLRQPNVAIIPRMIAEIHEELPQTRKSSRKINKSNEQTIPPKFFEYENSNVNKEKALNQIIVPTFPQDKYDGKSGSIQNSIQHVSVPNVANIPPIINKDCEKLPQSSKSSRQINKSNEQTIPPITKECVVKLYRNINDKCDQTKTLGAERMSRTMKSNMTISKLAESDPLICELKSQYLNNPTPNVDQKIHMINAQQKSKELGTLLYKLKTNTDNPISELKDFLNPIYFNTIVSYVKELSGFIQNRTKKTPPLVENLRDSLLECAEIVENNIVEPEGNLSLRASLKLFRTMMLTDWPEVFSGKGLQPVEATGKKSKRISTRKRKSVSSKDVLEEHLSWKKNCEVDPLWKPPNRLAVNETSDDLSSSFPALAELLKIKAKTPLNRQTKERGCHNEDNVEPALSETDVEDVIPVHPVSPRKKPKIRVVDFSKDILTMNEDSKKNQKSLEEDHLPQCSAISHSTSQGDENYPLAPDQEDIFFNEENITTVREISQSQKPASPKKKYDKKYACCFCDKLICHFSRHMKCLHSKEPEVRKLLAEPEGSEERRTLYNKLRRMASFQHNTKCIRNKTDNLILVRRPSGKQKCKYLPCTFCLGFFADNCLHLHEQKCKLRSENDNLENSLRNSATLLARSISPGTEVGSNAGATSEEGNRSETVEDPACLNTDDEEAAFSAKGTDTEDAVHQAPPKKRLKRQHGNALKRIPTIKEVKPPKYQNPVEEDNTSRWSEGSGSASRDDEHYSLESENEENITVLKENSAQFQKPRSRQKKQQKKRKPRLRKKKQQGKRKWDKKYACIFCEKLIGNYSRHLKQMHPDEPDVRRLLNEPEGSEERKVIYSKLRKMGNFQYNTKCIRNKTGNIILIKRSKNENRKNLPCTFCLGFYSAKFMQKHKLKCKLRGENDNLEISLRNSAALLARSTSPGPEVGSNTAAGATSEGGNCCETVEETACLNTDNEEAALSAKGTDIENAVHQAPPKKRLKRQHVRALTRTPTIKEVKPQSNLKPAEQGSTSQWSEGSGSASRDDEHYSLESENEENITMLKENFSQSQKPRLRQKKQQEKRKPRSRKQKQGKRKWDKKYACIFCEKLIGNYSRHMKRMHSDEPEVRRLLNEPEGSEERNLIYDKLRRMGNFQYNTKCIRNKTGNIILIKRSKNENRKNLPCTFCLGFYSENFMQRHELKCKLRGENDNLENSLRNSADQFASSISPGTEVGSNGGATSEEGNCSEKVEGSAISEKATVEGNDEVTDSKNIKLESERYPKRKRRTLIPKEAVFDKPAFRIKASRKRKGLKSDTVFADLPEATTSSSEEQCLLESSDRWKACQIKLEEAKKESKELFLNTVKEKVPANKKRKGRKRKIDGQQLYEGPEIDASSFDPALISKLLDLKTKIENEIELEEEEENTTVFGDSCKRNEPTEDSADHKMKTCEITDRPTNIVSTSNTESSSHFVLGESQGREIINENSPSKDPDHPTNTVITKMSAENVTDKTKTSDTTDCSTNCSLAETEETTISINLEHPTDSLMTEKQDKNTAIETNTLDSGENPTNTLLFETSDKNLSNKSIISECAENLPNTCTGDTPSRNTVKSSSPSDDAETPSTTLIKETVIKNGLDKNTENSTTTFLNETSCLHDIADDANSSSNTCPSETLSKQCLHEMTDNSETLSNTTLSKTLIKNNSNQEADNTEHPSNTFSCEISSTNHSNENPSNTFSCETSSTNNSNENPSNTFSSETSSTNNSNENPSNTFSSETSSTNNSNENPSNTFSSETSSTNHSNENPSNTFSSETSSTNCSYENPFNTFPGETSSKNSSNMDAEPNLLTVAKMESDDDPLKVKDRLLFCVFCKQQQKCKMAKHFKLKHSNESEVKEFMALPPNSLDRKRLISRLVHQGYFLHNMSVLSEGKGEIMPMRRSRKNPVAPSEMSMCPTCGGTYMKSSLCFHVSKCNRINTNLGKFGNRLLIQELMLSQDNIKHSEFRKYVLSKMEEDEITDAVKNDFLLIKWGLNLYKLYGSRSHQYQCKFVINRLREAGCLLVAVKKLKPELKGFIDLYKPNMYVVVKAAVYSNRVAGFHLGYFRNPLLATEIGVTLKKLSKVLTRFCLEEGIEPDKKGIASFMSTMDLHWKDDVKQVAKFSKSQRTLKLTLEVLAEDVQKLYTYVKNKETNFKEKLKEGYDRIVYDQLSKLTLFQVLMLNFHNAGDIDKIRLENYSKNMPNINLDGREESDALGKIVNETWNKVELKKKAQKSTVIWFSPNTEESIELLLKLRKGQGQELEANPYLFPSLKRKSGAYCALEVFNKYVRKCETNNLYWLLNRQKKYVSIMTAVLNLNSDQLEKLVSTLGVSENSHLETMNFANISELVYKVRYKVSATELRPTNIENGEKSESRNNTHSEQNSNKDCLDSDENCSLGNLKTANTTSRKSKLQTNKSHNRRKIPTMELHEKNLITACFSEFMLGQSQKMPSVKVIDKFLRLYGDKLNPHNRTRQKIWNKVYYACKGKFEQEKRNKRKKNESTKLAEKEENNTSGSSYSTSSTQCLSPSETDPTSNLDRYSANQAHPQPSSSPNPDQPFSSNVDPQPSSSLSPDQPISSNVDLQPFSCSGLEEPSSSNVDPQPFSSLSPDQPISSNVDLQPSSHSGLEEPSSSNVDPQDTSSRSGLEEPSSSDVDPQPISNPDPYTSSRSGPEEPSSSNVDPYPIPGPEQLSSSHDDSQPTYAPLVPLAPFSYSPEQSSSPHPSSSNLSPEHSSPSFLYPWS